MPRPNRNASEGHLIYFTTEQDERLRRAADHRGMSVSSLVREGTMRMVREAEEERRETKRVREEKEERAFVPRNPHQSRGLGLRRHSRDRADEFREPEPALPPPLPPVIIAAPSSGGDIVDRFADYVRSAPNSIARQDREREVVRMLRAASRSEEEIKDLARRLDEKLGTTSPVRKMFDWLTGKSI